MKTPFANLWVRYLATCAFIMLFVDIRWILHPLLDENAPLILFILPVIFAALVGSFFTGVFATLLSALLGDYFFIKPYYSIIIGNHRDFTEILTFVVIGIIISWLVEQLHSARAVAEEKAAEAQKEAFESRIAEARARESEERFRNVADAAPVLIWTADAAKNCTWFNKPWLDFTERTMEQEVGRGWTEGVHPSDLEHYLATRDAAFERREPFSMEYRLRRANKEFRWISDTGVPRFSAENDFLGYIGTCIDIHDRRLAEREQIRLLEEARQAHAQTEIASRLKDEFIATVSHELRTPLNAILGWTQMMHSGIVNQDQYKKAIDVIERNARLQAQLIEDLLDVTRIASGKLQLNLRKVKLDEVIDAAIDTIRPAATAKEVDLHKTSGSPETIIWADPDRLQQVVWNLLSNAVKFTTPKGAVKIHIEKTNSFAEIFVEDTGKGIEPEFLPFVFDRFRQAEQSTTRKYGGLGLGLAIVRNIVEMHGGTVQADSEGANKGAKFTVRLPIRALSEAGKTLQIKSEKGIPAVGLSNLPELSVDLQNTKIMIVDDEADALELLSSLLRVYGAEVTVCRTAPEALDAIPNVKPQVLVSDVGMPEMDGYTLIEKIRQLPPESGGQIPAIALTAYTRIEDRVRALTQGYQMFVPKPVEPSELVAAIKSLAGLNDNLQKNIDERNGNGNYSN